MDFRACDEAVPAEPGKTGGMLMQAVGQADALGVGDGEEAVRFGVAIHARLVGEETRRDFITLLGGAAAALTQRPAAARAVS